MVMYDEGVYSAHNGMKRTMWAGERSIVLRRIHTEEYDCVNLHERPWITLYPQEYLL